MTAKEFRVFGAPGCGKTTYLARQIGRAVERFGPDGVLVASFTRTAASEIASRDLGARGRAINEANVGTLHSLAYRAIGRPPVAEGARAFGRWNEFQVGKGRRSFLWSEDDRSAPRFSIDDPYASARNPEVGGDLDLEGMLSRLSHARNLMRLQHATAASETLRVFHEQWEEFKEELGMVDFTDMIDRARHAPPPRGVSVGFFDEVQDFSPLELALVRHWGDSLDWIVLAGDDDQAIYGFRGATPSAFLSPAIPDAQVTVLPKSYRLASEIKNYATDWISCNRERRPKNFEAAEVGGFVGSLAVDLGRDCWALAPVLEDDVRAGRSAMVLASCSYMLDSLIDSLRARGVPFANKYRETNRRWNPLSEESKWRAFLAPLEHARLWTWGEFGAWAELVRAEFFARKGAKAAIDRMAAKYEDKAVTQDDLRYAFGERSPPFWESLFAADISFLQSIALPKHAERLVYPVLVRDRHGNDALFKPPLLTVGTIHSVKGGEADVVYLSPWISRSAWNAAESEEGKAELRRVFYVGMTRARSRLSWLSCHGETVHALLGRGL